MKKRYLVAPSLIIFFIFASERPLEGGGADRSEEILRRVDEMWRGTSSISRVRMKIKTSFYERGLEMEVWALGFDYTLIRIIKPEKEKGVATLKVKRDIWNYLPRVDRVIKIPSSMMLSNWMGSHFTNDDLVKESTLLEDYTHSVTFEGEREGREIWEITLNPRPEAAVVWGRIVLLVRKKDVIPLRQVYYDEDMKEVRVLTFHDVKELDGRILPARLVMRPSEKPEEYTEIEYITADFEAGLKPGFFSLSNLKR